MISVNREKCISFLKAHQLLLIDLFIIALFYSAFLFTRHYDCDSYALLINGNRDAAATNLQMGRVPEWLLYRGFELIGFPAQRHPRLGLALLILACAYSVSRLSSQLAAAMKPEGPGMLCAVNAAVLLTILNASFYEGWVYFTECAYDRAISVILIFSAISVFLQAGKSWRDYLLSFLLLSLAIDMYQVYIEVFLAYALLWLLMEHRLRWSRRAFRDLLALIAVGLGASLQNILTMRWLNARGLIPDNARSATAHLSVMIENLRQIAAAQPAVWRDFQGAMPDWSLPAFALILALLLARAAVRNRCTWQETLLAVLAMLAGYCALYAPLLLSGAFWMPPRVILGFFSFLSCGALLALFADGAHADRAVLLSCAALIALAGIRIQAISEDNIASGRIDQSDVQEIGAAIQAYEEGTGNAVDTIAVHFDGQVTWYQPSTRYQIMDINVRGFVKPWSDVNMINWYLGTSYARRDMSDAEYRRIFGDSGWDVFDASQQLHFEGSTLYLAVY